jgi:hypothetical protein
LTVTKRNIFRVVLVAGALAYFGCRARTVGEERGVGEVDDVLGWSQGAQGTVDAEAANA